MWRELHSKLRAPFVSNTKLSEIDRTFLDPMREFNAGDGNRGAPKALQSKHWTQTKFDRWMVLFEQIDIRHVQERHPEPCFMEPS